MYRVYRLTKKHKRKTDPVAKKKLNVTFGVFFDGTCNSIANIDERKNFETFLKEEKGLTENNRDAFFKANKMYAERNAFYEKTGSYGNEYTNVARFYKCFKKTDKNQEKEAEKIFVPIYIEGIATKPREIGKKINYDKKASEESYYVGNEECYITCNDSLYASAFGMGKFGVKSKVESACKKIRKEVKETIDDLGLANKADKVLLTVDLYVFGFSRGAAAARCFSACLQKQMGETVTELHNEGGEIYHQWGDKMRELSREEKGYKTCLVRSWLDSLGSSMNILLWGRVGVKFLGLFDTVSSYGLSFKDDVGELSLEINDNVDRVVQICAGDERRALFALTDITSAGGKGESIILPGAHSDIGGGYAAQKKEYFRKNLCHAGRLDAEVLWDEGWFAIGKTERVVSNLYSVIPFQLMKEKICNVDIVFEGDKLDKYRLPPSGGLHIDGVWHEYSKDLCDFYDAIKLGDYNAYYRMEDGDIKCLQKEAYDTSAKISEEKEKQKTLQAKGAHGDTIKLYKECQMVLENELYEIQVKRTTYNEELLKRIRNGYLHLSAKNDKFMDRIISRPRKKGNRSVIKG